MCPDPIEWPSRIPTPSPMERVKPIRKRKQKEETSDEPGFPVADEAPDSASEPAPDPPQDEKRDEDDGGRLDLII